LVVIIANGTQGGNFTPGEFVSLFIFSGFILLFVLFIAMQFFMLAGGDIRFPKRVIKKAEDTIRIGRFLFGLVILLFISIDTLESSGNFTRTDFSWHLWRNAAVIFTCIGAYLMMLGGFTGLMTQLAYKEWLGRVNTEQRRMELELEIGADR